MTENIVNFLETAYSDEKLAALLAHAQDGKLAYNSCCCLIGIPSADHALFGKAEFCGKEDEPSWHLENARDLPYAAEAENEFLWLGSNGYGLSDNSLRCKRLIPLILAEQERRAKLKTEPDALLVAASVAQ